MDTIIYLAIVVIVFLLFFFWGRNRKEQKERPPVNKKVTQLKNPYRREAVFMCNAIEEIDDNLLQLYGESINSPLRPGMRIEISGNEYVIKEVYADDDTPEKPDAEAAAGVPGTPIVIEKGKLDWKNFQQKLERDMVVPLKLK